MKSNGIRSKLIEPNLFEISVAPGQRGARDVFSALRALVPGGEKRRQPWSDGAVTLQSTHTNKDNPSVDVQFVLTLRNRPCLRILRPLVVHDEKFEIEQLAGEEFIEPDGTEAAGDVDAKGLSTAELTWMLYMPLGSYLLVRSRRLPLRMSFYSLGNFGIERDGYCIGSYGWGPVWSASESSPPGRGTPLVAIPVLNAGIMGGQPEPIFFDFSGPAREPEMRASMISYIIPRTAPLIVYDLDNSFRSPDRKSLDEWVSTESLKLARYLAEIP